MPRLVALSVTLVLLVVTLPPPAAAADCTTPDPGRDCRADPLPLEEAGWIWYADFDATVEPGESLPCAMQATTWFSFTATETRQARFDTRGHNTDHGVAIAGYEAGAYLACASSASDLRFDCVAGRTYEVQVGSESAARGTIELLFDACGGFTVPSPPATLELVPGPGRGEITMVWEEPSFGGGKPRTGYEIRGGYACETPLETLAATATSFVVAGLGEGDEHCLSVAAVNELGTGSDASLFGSPAGTTSQPRDPLATGAPRKILVTWAAPTVDGGSAPSSFRVEAADTPSGPFAPLTSVAGNKRSYTDADLGPATTRSYRVVAVNAWGDSLPSAVVAATTPDVPSAPRAVHAEPGLVPMTVLVEWAPPLSDGGSGVADYEVWRAPASGGDATLVGRSSGSSFSDTTTEVDGAYRYEVRARNAAGTGPASEPSCTRALVLGDRLFGDACD